MFGGDQDNRQKTININLKDTKDLEFIKLHVLPHVDVLLESYRPGKMEKLGLSTAEVHKINPKVIYGRLSGYGQKPSKYSQRAGHDMNYLALSGILYKFRRFAKQNPPSFPANFLADFASGSLHLFN